MPFIGMINNLTNKKLLFPPTVIYIFAKTIRPAVPEIIKIIQGESLTEQWT